MGRIINIVSIVFILLVSFLNEAKNQEVKYKLEVACPDSLKELNQIRQLNSALYNDSLTIIRELQKLRSNYFRKGYIGAGYSTPVIIEGVFYTDFNPGVKYYWGNITYPPDLPVEFTRIIKGLKSRSEEPVRLDKGFDFHEEIVNHLEDNGFPFASVRFDSIVITDGVVNASLEVLPGPLVVIDSIVDRSGDLLSARVLQQMIGIKKGQPYNESKIKNAGDNIEFSNLLALAGPVEPGFKDDKAWIYVGLKKKRANSFDGIIGLVPQSSSNNGISLSGKLDLEVNNLFKQAENFHIHWKAPGGSDQRLRTGFELPYVFGLPLGLTGAFELFKKGESYINTNWMAGLQVSLQTNNKLGFFYKEKTSNILNESLSGNIFDVKSGIYGFSWNYISIKNLYNPRNGIYINTNTGIGTKEVDNEDLEESTHSYFEAEGNADFFHNIFNQIVLHVGVGGGMIGGGEVYENERYRLGGIASVRGFDDESILADSYISGSLELRYLFSENSNFHIFSDAAYWKSRSNGIDRKDFPLGFGLGISLETKAGLILLDYALGHSEDYPFNLKNGKIHIGIKSLF